MPRGDGTGPMGMGAMTGRAAGYCAGAEVPGYVSPVPGRGLGMGFERGRGARGRGFSGGGGGRGWQNRFYATGLPSWKRFGGSAVPYQNPDPELEKRALKNQAEALHSELDFIKKRLGEIETGTGAR